MKKIRRANPRTSAVEAPLKAPASLNQAQNVRGGAEKILLVDDEKQLRDVVFLYLKQMGYRVMAAESGESAQKIWSEQGGQFDLLLTDMVMPGGLSGLQLGELLRAQKPGLKIILSTGYGEELADAGVVEEKGFTFLHKPFSNQVLAETVRKCLDAV
ncbi:MAG: response regulator [Verrucomicrobiota bacterium]|jgi:DNA-binding NtrC family response regulator